MRAQGVILLQFLGITIFFTSCRYADNVSLNIEYEIGATNFSDSTKTAYLSTQQAYRRAEGQAAFPDGGQSKYVYRRKGLYVFDVKNSELTYLKDLSKLDSLPWYISMHPRLVFKDSLLFYKCTIDSLKPMDSLEFIEMKRVFAECFSIDINTKKINQVDIEKFNKLYLKYKIRPVGGMFKRAEAHPLAEWGLVLKEIYPKSDEQYIDYFISWKSGGNSLSRRAIIEQIIAHKSKDEIREILQRMNDYKESLDAYDKDSYEFWMRDDYNQLRKLLEN